MGCLRVLGGGCAGGKVSETQPKCVELEYGCAVVWVAVEPEYAVSNGVRVRV